MDPVELPPNAVLDAPFVNGKPIARWEQLIDAGKRERNLILKISGFHESAWGLVVWSWERFIARGMGGSDLACSEYGIDFATYSSGVQKAEAGCASSLLGGGLGGFYGGSCAFMPVLFCR